MPFKMQERLETLLEQTTTLCPDLEVGLNGDVPIKSTDSGKGSSCSDKPARSSDTISNSSFAVNIRSRSSDAISSHYYSANKRSAAFDTGSCSSGDVSLPAITRSSSVNKLTLSWRGDDKDEVQSTTSTAVSTATEVEDSEPEPSESGVPTQIVVTVSPPADDTFDGGD